LAHINDKKAQHNGDFYGHGKAFEASNGESWKPWIPQQMSYETTYPLSGFKGFNIDPTTGFPIDPKTWWLNDDTIAYCKSFLTFCHSQKSFTSVVNSRLFSMAQKGKGKMMVTM